MSDSNAMYIHRCTTLYKNRKDRRRHRGVHAKVVIASNLLPAIFMRHEVRFAITTAMLAATACEATTARHR